MRIKYTVLCGVLTALLCVIGPLALPIGGIPITLITFVIYVIAASFDPRISITCVVLYIIIGCIGLPVFSGYSGGIVHLAGPGGGFILGYIPMVILIALFRDSTVKRTLSICISTLILYVCGCVGYMINVDHSLSAVITVCVLPFIPGDMIKIILSLILIPRFKRILCKNKQFLL